MRGSETVTVIPTVKTDRLRSPSGTAADPYDLVGCHVLPRASSEEGKGVIGIGGWDVYYFGAEPAPQHDWQIEVRGETHEIDGIPRDFIVKGRRKGLIISTRKVG